jgi:hypothetical protein
VVAAKYDEARIAEVCGTLDRSARTAFAAACAERLWPLVERYGSVTPLAENDIPTLRRALDAAWRAASGSDEDLAQARDVAESMVPFEDENWTVEAGYAQNAIAAIAYASRAWLSDDPQEAVWAARQLYEAADYGAQQSSGGVLREYTRAVEDELLDTRIVREAVTAIVQDLASARSQSSEVLRQRVEMAAQAFARLFP